MDSLIKTRAVILIERTSTNVDVKTRTTFKSRTPFVHVQYTHMYTVQKQTQYDFWVCCSYDKVIHTYFTLILSKFSQLSLHGVSCFSNLRMTNDTNVFTGFYFVLAVTIKRTNCLPLVFLKLHNRYLVLCREFDRS